MSGTSYPDVTFYAIDAVEAAAGEARSAADAARDVVAAVETTRSALASSAPASDAVSAVGDSMTAPRADLVGLAAALDDARAGLTALADTLSWLQPQIAQAISDLDELYHRRNAWAFVDGSTLPPASLRAPELTEKLQAAQHHLDLLLEQRDAAVQAALAHLKVPHDAAASWKKAKAVLRAAGIDGVGDLTPEKLAAAITAVARRIAHGGSRPDADDVALLADLLAQWKDDPEVTSKAFRDLGGHDTAAVVDVLGDAVVVGALPLSVAAATASAFRRALSTGSADWTSAQAGKFADSLLDGASAAIGGGVAAIGYLFGDASGAPLGEQLTVAMADRVDRVERDPQSGHQGQPWFDYSPMPGGRVLAEAEGDDRAARVDDLAGRVLETLGHYPGAALDWLTQPGPGYLRDGNGMGAERVAYWFGERDWSLDATGDGFEGPAALWSGAQKVPGGPLAVPPDTATWNRVESVVSRIMTSLAHNPAYVPGAPSGVGAAQLAAAIDVQVPMLTESPITAHPDYLPQGPSSDLVSVSLPYRTDPVAVPGLEAGDLARLVGVAASDPAGAQVLQTGVQHYQDALLRALAAEPTRTAQEGMSPTDSVLDRVVALQAMLDGSGAGGVLAQATTHDAAVDAAVDAAGDLVGMIPVPGVSGVLGEGADAVLTWGVDQAQGWATDQVMSAGSDALKSWGHAYDHVAAQVDAGHAAGLDASRDTVQQALATLDVPFSSDRARVEYLAHFPAVYDDVFANYSQAAKHLADDPGPLTPGR